MRAVFIHDHRFMIGSNGEIYSSGGLPYSAWHRYLKVFDTLHIIGRLGGSLGEADSSRYVKSSGPNVSFSFVPNTAIVLGRRAAMAAAREIIDKELSTAEALIARTSALAHIAVSIAQQRHLPYAIEVVACPLDAYWNHGSLSGKLYAPIAYAKQRLLLKNASHAIYVTKKFLQGRYPCPGQTSWASNVHIEARDVGVSPQRMQHARDANHPIIFGTIASLSTRYKGIQTALAALCAIRKLKINFEYRILGSGDQTQWRLLAGRLGIASQVTFFASVPAGDPVFRWLDGIDVYLQPSLTEGLPRSLIEAMSRACPCIGSSAGGIPELLDQESIHTPGNVSELKRLLYRACVDPAWLRQQSDRNFRASKEFSLAALDARRDAFWTSFANQVRAKSQTP
jgi:glycosyltransferase involved in cell wall biosynthesis